MAARPFALLLLLCLALAAAPASAQQPARTGFDHLLHARNLATSGAKPIPCASCHRAARGLLVGRPGHTACYGACHGALPSIAEARRLSARPPADDDARTRLSTCTPCHAASELASARSAPAFPPYTLDSDFGLELSHARHAAASCARCHPATRRPATPRAVPHQRCLGCHTNAASPPTFDMAACESCHYPAVGAGNAPKLARSQITVTTAFSHATHQTYAARRGAAPSCLPCHRQVPADNNAPGVVPAPAAETCAETGCHDGTAAFAITERCTSCHRDPPDTPYQVPRPTRGYSHQQHAEAQAQLGCLGCHAATERGAPEPTRHRVCATCHAKDFGSPSPLICGACHTATEPWRVLRADRRPTQRTTFGARMDHATHRLPCERCHTLTTATRQLRLPRDHATCAGSGCHRLGGGPAPAFERCEACHVAELVARRASARAAAPWSVRTLFDHRSHTTTAEGLPLTCVGCHLSVDGALDTLATPPKRTCAPCHDGVRAFGLTGTACARCHGGRR